VNLMTDETVVAGAASVSPEYLAGTRMVEGARAAMRARTPQGVSQSTTVGVAITVNDNV